MTQKEESYYEVEIRSVEAWRTQEGWEWNQTFFEDRLIMAESVLASSRKLLAALREEGFLSEWSKGRVRVFDEGDLIEIQDKNTDEPIFALFLREIKNEKEGEDNV